MPQQSDFPRGPYEPRITLGGIPALIAALVQLPSINRERQRAHNLAELDKQISAGDPVYISDAEQHLKDSKWLKQQGIDSETAKSRLADIGRQRQASQSLKLLGQGYAAGRLNSQQMLGMGLSSGDPNTLGMVESLIKASDPQALARMSQSTAIAENRATNFGIDPATGQREQTVKERTTGAEVAGHEAVAKINKDARIEATKIAGRFSLRRAHIMADATSGRATEKLQGTFLKTMTAATDAHTKLFQRTAMTAMPSLNTALLKDLDKGGMSPEQVGATVGQIDMNLAPVVAYDADLLQGKKSLAQAATDAIMANKDSVLFTEADTGKVHSLGEFLTPDNKVKPGTPQEMAFQAGQLMTGLTKAIQASLLDNKGQPRGVYADNLEAFKATQAKPVFGDDDSPTATANAPDNPESNYKDDDK